MAQQDLTKLCVDEFFERVLAPMEKNLLEKMNADAKINRIGTMLRIRLPNDFKVTSDPRICTCHPDAKKYALSECKANHLVASLREVSREFS